MKVAKLTSLNEKSQTLDRQLHALDNDVDKLFLCLQGRVRLGTGVDGARGENIAGEFQVVADTGSANTEFSVTHTIGAVPIGYLVTKTNKAGVVYDSGTAWTSTTIYLKCSTANTTISLFLLQ